MKGRREEFELSQIRTTSAAFLESYNRTLPAGYPRASTALLRKFQAAHPTLFKHGDQWSVALHRKRMMDWLSSNSQLV
ncbi:MAG: hypothetical protein A3J58_02520 [Candidatus Sungbacteria bacterium RIFCSPHIGHO2_02_FULL_52_23]|uniref:Uncharacterized protein n=1 Tax=Candidatus Sungbacteria bacterium RIFCSPHIGHO2_02_FULL_52_23 TaxID=1802274 RepID=A0A1G2KXF0_9BACT|nr:MAG: hypothetical protein A3J58_02520 [Candidatus Sungbacteria bacterium RIFCSPHIGHO2_02_FULL_52_23]